MSRMKALGAAAGVAMTVALAAPGAALASTDSVEWYRDCTPGYFCVFEHADGTGHWFRDYQSPHSSLTAPIGGFIYDQQISGMFNRGDKTWCLFTGLNYTGDSLVVLPGAGGSLVPEGFNDVIRSFRIC